MFKFGTIGTYKQVRNNPRCKAQISLKNGSVVVLNEAAKTALTPADAATAKLLKVYVVNNIIDKPEVLDSGDFVVEAGEYVRAFRLADLVGLPVELTDDLVKTAYASVAVGDLLVPCDDTADASNKGAWKKDASTANTYKVNLQVVEKTTFGGKGLLCKVVVN